VVAIYGGDSMQRQQDALKSGAAIVVGTPGRVHDLIRRGTMNLKHCAHAVLDEADEMLNQGFYEEVTRILDFVPAGRQVMLFSATVPEDIRRLIAKYTTNAETLLLSGDVFTVDHIHHIRYELSDAYPKPRNLLYVLELEDPDNAIIFCNTRDDTELVTAVLNRNGFDAELLNGDLPQKERERVMNRIKRGEVAFMVATDLAARGIDISDLGHVINYSLPEDAAVYLHRVGRTGRIGKKGTAINLTSGRELGTLTTLEKKYNVVFERRQMPSAEQAAHMWSERHVKELKEAAQGSIYEGFLALASTLKLRPDADELIAFMLKSFFAHRRMEKAQSGEGEPQTEVREVREPREPRRLSSDKGGPRRDRDRGERGSPRPERGPRKERERDRVPEHMPSEPMRDARTAPGGSAAVASNGDREAFERLQAGKPLPPLEDPTTSSHHEESSDSGERRERRERRPRREETPVEVTPGVTRLWLNHGKTDKVTDGPGLISALEAIGAPSGKITKAELRGTYSYVYVADADAVSFEELAGKPLNEKPLKIERARR